MNNGTANLEIFYKVRWVDCPDVLSEAISDHWLLVSLGSDCQMLKIQGTD